MVDDGVLYWKYHPKWTRHPMRQLVLKMRKEILMIVHDQKLSDHLGVTRTLHRAKGQVTGQV